MIRPNARNRVRLDISINSLDEFLHEIQDLLNHVALNSHDNDKYLDTVSLVTGKYHLTVLEFNPDMDKEKYDRELMEWIKHSKQQKEMQNDPS